ncbi:hypothetical protein F4821DRAFT_153409 [Hypoxylon rubiginosum]|uniref:Uncharacterized protein n=1 Tax=Hypoxylon rubiginosum TaxID=110542 RepID=A0ACC0CYF4_9PEZI|nr:hypothetical protein F4821DRAFT_153409 [Hypoxylon rubiginosum]
MASLTISELLTIISYFDMRICLYAYIRVYLVLISTSLMFGFWSPRAPRCPHRASRPLRALRALLYYWSGPTLLEAWIFTAPAI